MYLLSSVRKGQIYSATVCTLIVPVSSLIKGVRH